MLKEAGFFSPKNNFSALHTPPPNQFRPVDGLRGLSILLVLIIHSFWFLSIFDDKATEFFYASPVWLNWVYNGELGVDIFFVISGFLISSILMAEYRDTGGIRFSRFYKRRFMRLMPAYILAIILGLVLLPENQQYVWSNLLYINNLLPAETHFMPWTWSLAIEEQFYFIFPLLLVCSLKLKNKSALFFLAGLLFFSSFLIRYFVIKYYQLSLPICWYEGACDGFYHVIDSIYVKPWARFGSFLPGIFVAYLHVFHRESVVGLFNRQARYINMLVMLAVLVALIVMSVPVNNQLITYSDNFGVAYYVSYRNLFTAAVGMILLASLYCERGLSRSIAIGLSSRALYLIGQLAYSAYLLHPFVFGLIYAILYQEAGALSYWQKIGIVITLGFPLTFFIAGIVYLFVERPFMNMRRSPEHNSQTLVDG